MTEGIYTTSDSSCMSFEDLVFQLKTEVSCSHEKRNWSFDELTGGRDCFFDNECYLKAKEWFETYMILIRETNNI